MILMKFCLKNHIFLKMSGDAHIINLLDQDFLANIPKSYNLMQKMANTVEVSIFRGIIYLFS